MFDNGFGSPVNSSFGNTELFSPPVEPGSLYEYNQRRKSLGMATPELPSVPYIQSDRPINYADPVDTTVAPFIRSSDIMTLDPDPFGDRTVKYGAATSQAFDSSHVDGLTVFGKPISRSQLLSTEAGRELISISEKNRLGIRRDFWDGLIRDIGIEDIPFFGSIAFLGNSISDAVDVSNTFKKLQNHEPVTDDNLIKARLYLAEQEYNANGTWGATVGELIRTMGPFMMEFGAVNSGLGAARNLLAKSLVKNRSPWAAEVGLTGAQKFMMKRTAENALTALGKDFTKAAPELLTKGVVGEADILKDGITQALKNDVLRSKLNRTLTDTAASLLKSDPLTNRLYSGLPESTRKWLARRMASSELSEATARLTTETSVKKTLMSGLRSTKDHLLTSILDFGNWGASSAAVARMKNDTVMRHVSDALWTLFLDAPIRGAVIQAPGHFIAKPLISVASGNGLDAVDPMELSFQASAFSQGNKDLMENAGAKALGARVFTYAMGDAGRAFGSIARAISVGSGLSQVLHQGTAGAVQNASAHIVRNIRKSSGAPGSIKNVIFEGLIPEGEGYQTGSVLRDLIDKYVVKPEDIRDNIVYDKAEAVIRKLGMSGKLDHEVMEAAIRSNSADLLPTTVREAVGSDVDAFAKAALQDAYKANVDDLRFRSFFNLFVADHIQRLGISPDKINAMFEKAGYHGTFGTMLGARYSEVAKGLFGFDDKGQDDFRSRLSNALSGVWPGWKQITAEAVGFTVPGLLRAGLHRAMRSIGGGTRATQLMGVHQKINFLTSHPVTARTSARDYVAAAKEHVENLDRRRTELQKKLDELGSVEGSLAVPEGKRTDVDTTRIAEYTVLTDSVKQLDKEIEKAKPTLDSLLQQLSEGGRIIDDSDVFVEVDRRGSNVSNGHTVTTDPASDVAQTMSKYSAVREVLAEYAEMRSRLHRKMSDESAGAFRRFAHKLTGLAGFFMTGDANLLRENPFQWSEVDHGMVPGLGDTLEREYNELYKSVATEQANARREQAKLSVAAKRANDPKGYGYDRTDPGASDREVPATEVFEEMEGPDGALHTYEVDVDAVHAETRKRFADRAKAIFDEYMSRMGVMSFSNAELKNIVMDEVAARDNLYRRSHADDVFVGSDGRKVSFSELYEKHRGDVDRQVADAMRKTLSVLMNTSTGSVGVDGAPKSSLQVRSDSTDSAASLMNVFDAVPANYNRMDLAALAHVMQQRGLRNVFVNHVVDGHMELGDQLSADSVTPEIVSSLSRFTTIPYDLAREQITSGTLSEYEGAALETLARRLRFSYDGTKEDLHRRNLALLDIIRTRCIVDNPATERRYVKEVEAPSDNRPAVPQQSRVLDVTVKRRRNGWHVADEDGEDHVFNTDEELDAYMKSKGYDRSEFEYAFTTAYNISSDNPIAMLDILHLGGSGGEYERELERALGSGSGANPDAGDPRFQHTIDSNGNRVGRYKSIEEADARRAEMIAEADEFLKIVGDPKINTDYKWELFAPEGANRRSNEVRETATNRMKRLETAYNRVYGDEYGFIAAADRVLRRHGVHVDSGTRGAVGEGMRALSGLFAHRYSLPLRAFHDVTKTGRIYMPIDYGRFQDIPSGILASANFRAYTRNLRYIQRMCWTPDHEGKFDNAVPGPVIKMLSRLDSILAQRESYYRDGEKQPERANGFDRLRRFLRCKDIASAPAGKAWISRQAFELINTAFAFFQLERDAAHGTSTLPFSEELRDIASDFRGSVEFRTYFGELDRVFGGNGFGGIDLRNMERMSRTPKNQGKSEEPTGLRRVFEFLPGVGTPEFDRAVDKFMLMGLDRDQMMTLLGDLQNRLHHDPVTVKRITESIRSLSGDDSVEGTSGRRPSSGKAEDLQKLSRVIDEIVGFYEEWLNETKYKDAKHPYVIKDRLGFAASIFDKIAKIGRPVYENDPAEWTSRAYAAIDAHLADTVNTYREDNAPVGKTPEPTGKNTGSPEPTGKSTESPEPTGKSTESPEPTGESTEPPVDIYDTASDDGVLSVDTDATPKVMDLRYVDDPSLATPAEYDGLMMSVAGSSVDSTHVPLTTKDATTNSYKLNASALAPFLLSSVNDIPAELRKSSAGNRYLNPDDMTSLARRLFPGYSEDVYQEVFKASTDYNFKINKDLDIFHDSMPSSKREALYVRDVRKAVHEDLFGLKSETNEDDEGSKLVEAGVFASNSEVIAKSILNQQFRNLMSAVSPHTMDSDVGIFRDVKAKMPSVISRVRGVVSALDAEIKSGKSADVEATRSRRELVGESLKLIDALDRMLNVREYAPAGTSEAKLAAMYDKALIEFTGYDPYEVTSGKGARGPLIQNSVSKANRRIRSSITALLYGGPGNAPISRQLAGFLMYLANLKPYERTKFLAPRNGTVALEAQTMRLVADEGVQSRRDTQVATSRSLHIITPNVGPTGSENPGIRTYRVSFLPLAGRTGRDMIGISARIDAAIRKALADPKNKSTLFRPTAADESRGSRAKQFTVASALRAVEANGRIIADVLVDSGVIDFDSPVYSMLTSPDVLRRLRTTSTQEMNFRSGNTPTGDRRKKSRSRIEGPSESDFEALCEDLQNGDEYVSDDNSELSQNSALRRLATHVTAEPGGADAYSIPLLSRLLRGLRRLGELKDNEITLEDAYRFGESMFTTGVEPSNKEFDQKNPALRAHRTSEWNEWMSSYASTLPVNIVHGDINPRRAKSIDRSSITAVVPGLNPEATGFLSGNVFRKMRFDLVAAERALDRHRDKQLIDKKGKDAKKRLADIDRKFDAEISDAVDGPRYRYNTWGNSRRDPVFVKAVVKGYDLNEINDACENQFDLEMLSLGPRQKIVTETTPDGKTVQTVKTVRMAKRDMYFRMANFLMSATGLKYDVTKSENKKTGAADYYLRCSADAMEEKAVDAIGEEGATKLAKVSDYASSVRDYGSRVAYNALAGYKPSRVVTIPVFPGEHSSYVLMQVPVEYVRELAVKNPKCKNYKGFSKYMLDKLGLSSMGHETKRTAISSGEADPIPMYGIREVPDGKGGTRTLTGKNYVVYTWHDSPEGDGSIGKNEDNIGSTYGVGYGMEALRSRTPVPRLVNAKPHMMSPDALYKSMILMGRDGAEEYGCEGRFLSGGAPDVFHRAATKVLGKLGELAPLSSAVCMDSDSVKIDRVLNSPVNRVKIGEEDTVSLMTFINRRFRDALAKDGSSAFVVDGNALSELDAKQVDALVGDIPWADGGDKLPHRMSELFGDGLMIVPVDGTSTPTFGLAFERPDVSMYSVANVSHFATPTMGKCPRNHGFADAMALASSVAGGFISDANYAGVAKEVGNSVAELVSRHGIIAAVTCMDPRVAAAFAKTAVSAVGHTLGGELESGQNHIDAATTAMFAEARKQMNLPMFAFDYALASNGSTVSYDTETGKFIEHHTTDSQMILDTLKGGRVIPKNLRKLYGVGGKSAGYLSALCNVNFDITDHKNGGDRMRLGWYLDDTAFDNACGGLPEHSCIARAWEKASAAAQKGASRDHLVMATLENVFTELRSKQLEWRAEPKNTERRDAVSDIKKEIALVFMNHRGEHISDLRTSKVDYDSSSRPFSDFSEYWNTVCFDDLFKTTGDGSTMVFDRTAVRFGMHLDAKPGTNGGATSHIYLAGTKLGFPRTPSYNGSMWNQSVRAALPVTERKDRPGEGACWIPGDTGLVSPDPYTLKILGCDHDGDKSKMFALKYDEFGLADNLFDRAADADVMMPVTPAGVPLDELLNDDDSTGDGARAQLRSRLVDLGYLDIPDADAAVEGAYPRLSERYKRLCSNTLVRRLFDMSELVPTPPAHASKFIPMYNPTPEGRLGPASRGTKATPVDEKAFKAAKKRFENTASRYSRFSRRNVFRGSDDGVSSTYHGCQVSSVAEQASDARALSVDLAAALHIAMATGLFDGKSATRNIFGDMDASAWVDYMYHQDGISNATFDDIKDQVCDKLGWTPQMMDTFVIHCMTRTAGKGGSGNRIAQAPRTDAEFLDLVTDYLEEASDGAFAPMILVGDKSTSRASGAQQFRQFVGAVITGGRYTELGAGASAVRKMFGIDPETAESRSLPANDLYKAAREHATVEFVTNDRGEVVTSAATPAELLLSAVMRAVKNLELSGVDKFDKVGDAHLVVKALIDDARLSGNSVNAGYLYYLLGEAAGMGKEFNEVATRKSHQTKTFEFVPVKTAEDIANETSIISKMGVERSISREEWSSLVDKCEDFARWAVVNNRLDTVKNLMRSVNYMKIDPLNPRSFETISNRKAFFERFAKETEEHKPSGGASESAMLTGPRLRRMHTATLLANKAPYGFYTLRGRAHEALANSTGNLYKVVGMSANPGTKGDVRRDIARFGLKVAGAHTLDPSSYRYVNRAAATRQLEANFQMWPYILSMLVNPPTNSVDPGSVFNSHNALDVVRNVAKAVLPVSDQSTRIYAEDHNGDLGGASLTIGFLRAVNAMFNVQKYLACSSKAHLNNSFYSGIRAKNVGTGRGRNVDPPRFARYKYRPENMGGEFGSLTLLSPFFKTSGDPSAGVLREASERWASGELDGAGKRELNGKPRRGRGAPAGSFDISVENLRELRRELGIDSPDFLSQVRDNTSYDHTDSVAGIDGTLSGLGAGVSVNDVAFSRWMAEQIDICEAAVRALGDGRSVTPSSFIRQWLPLYSVLTSRTTGGGADASAGSLFPLLPMDVFRHVSTEADKLTATRGVRPLLDALYVIDSRPIERMQLDDADLATGAANNRDKVDDLSQKFSRLYTGGWEKPSTRSRFTNDINALRGEFRQIQDGGFGSNPENRTLIDLFTNGCPVGDLVNVLRRGQVQKRAPLPVARNTRPEVNDAVEHETDTVGSLDSGAVDKSAERVAGIYRGLLQANPDLSVDVRGSSVIIRSKWAGSGVTRFLKNVSKTGKAPGEFGNDEIGIVVKVDVSGRKSSELTTESVKSAAGSLTYAESLFNSRGRDGKSFGVRLGMRNPKDFLHLPQAFREAVVRKFGVSGYSDSRPVFTVDGRGLAVLTGRIVLGHDAKSSVAYHEYFHSALTMAREMGVLSEADIKAFGDAFGRGERPGWFNEEHAAEGFRQFIEDRIASGNPDFHQAALSSAEDKKDMRDIFGRIAEFLDGAFTSLKFSYGEGGATDEQVYAMVLRGFGAESKSGSRRKRVMSKAELSALADRLNVTDSIDKALELVSRDSDGTLRLSQSSEAVMDVTRKQIVSARAEVEHNRLQRSVAAAVRALNSVLPDPVELRNAIDVMAKNNAEFLKKIGGADVSDRGEEANGAPAPVETDSAGNPILEFEVPAELDGSAHDRVQLATSAAAGFEPLSRYDRSAELPVPPVMQRAAALNQAIRDGFRARLGTKYWQILGANCREAYASDSIDIAASIVRQALESKAFMENASAIIPGSTEDLGAPPEGLNHSPTGDGHGGHTKFSYEQEGDKKQRIVFANLLNIANAAQRMVPPNQKNSKRKAYASMADVVGYLMAADRVLPQEHIDNIQARILDISEQYPEGSALKEFSRFVVGELEELVHGLNVNEMFSYPGTEAPEVTSETVGSRSEAFDKFFRVLQAPLKEVGGLGEFGTRNLYELDGEKASAETEDPSFALYRNVLDVDAGNRPLDEASFNDAQSILRLALDAGYGLAAAEKLTREYGVGNSLIAGAEAFDSGIFSDIRKPQTLLEMAGDAGIGPAQLTAEDPMLDFFTQPAFAAYDTRTWLDSTVRDSFGGAPFREAMRGVHNDLDGVQHKLSATAAHVYRTLGLDCVPNQKLYAVEHREGEWKLGAGGDVTHGKTGVSGSYYDVYNNRRCGFAASKDYLRSTDMYLKAVGKAVGGNRKMSVGVDKVVVTWRSVAEYRDGGMSDDYFKKDAVEARVRSAKAGKNAAPLDVTLSRLKEQIPEEYLGYETHTGLYKRIVDSLTHHMKQLASVTKTEGKQLWVTGSTTERYNDKYLMNGSDVSDYLLRGLEIDGLMHTRKTSGGKRVGVFTIDTKDYIDWWLGSRHANDLVEKAGRDRGEITPEAISGPVVESINEMKRLVAKYPFLGVGDARYFHNVNTPFVQFEGDGMFMWGATRKVRDRRVEHNESVSEFERTYLDMITHGLRDDEGASKLPSDEQLELFRKSFRIQGRSVTSSDIRRMISEGYFMPGGEGHEKYQVTVPTDCTMADLSTILYERNCQLAWLTTLDASADAPWARQLAKELGGEDAVGRMIEAYEDAKEQEMIGGSRGISRFGLGLTDEQMYRMHGALPANFDLIKTAQTMADGVTNGVFFRNALATLLFTPDLDGMPTCYANPSALAAEYSGLGDEFWGMLARWWAQKHPGVKYDIRKSGVENAREIYKELFSGAPSDGGAFTLGGTPNGIKGLAPDGMSFGKKFYGLHNDLIDNDIRCLDDFVAQNGSEEEAGCGNHAFDYARHLLQSSRCFGTRGARLAIHRALAWSKSMSVATSFFFPLATRWESPIGAFGATATLGSNLSPDFLRNHAEAASAIQKVFGGKNSGWITDDFVGSKDFLRMLDSNDPFLADVLSWASALGVTLQDRSVNPVNPSNSLVVEDIKKMTEMIRGAVSDKAADNFKRVADQLLTRPGDRAFAYALNATKLAAVVQMAQKMRHVAMQHHKAFDPIRDLRKYADYINAEIGGIDPLKYAWAHPEMRSLLERLMFSWQWTRGAWEAGGGGAIEDVLLGTHNTNTEMRDYLFGRWARMYGTVMIGVPIMMQLMAKTLGLIMGHDDDDDKWFTWENEDKTRWAAADITPLLRGIENVDNVVAERTGLTADTVHRGWAAVGAGAGAALGGIPGAITGGILGLFAPRYTGRDANNMATGKRRYYMHFGKQGWEFKRWFDQPTKQFFSKLSMPTQRLIEGVLGRSLSWMDHELPWNDMGDVERWLNPTSDGALWNVCKAFLPFTYSGLSQYGDAGFLNAFGPVQMGASETALIERLKTRLGEWAENDREGYRFGAHQDFRKKHVNRQMEIGDILEDAKVNGFTSKQCDQLVTKALGQVTNRLYGRLFAAIPETPDGDFDKREIEHVARAINRLQRRRENVMASVKKRLERRGHEWKTLDTRIKDLYRTNVDAALRHPFTYRLNETPVRKRADY